MQIKIVKPGLLTTVQDLGRPKFRDQAIPLGGVMDRDAMRLANKAIGNDDNAAVLEFTYANAEFVAITHLLIAYAGGGAILQIKERELHANRPIFIPAGEKITFNFNAVGCRTYLAVAGGWAVETVLGSRSTYLAAHFGGFEGRAIRTDDVLQAGEHLTLLNKQILERLRGEKVKYPSWSTLNSPVAKDVNLIRVVPAQEFTWFDGASIINFLTKPYQLTAQSNRMGYHLQGNPLTKINQSELLSTAVTFGTIQVTGNGNLIMLMADGQTTGGYPRIAQIASVDLPLCAQLKPNETIFFQEISRTTAETLYLEREAELNQLSAAISHKFDHI